MLQAVDCYIWSTEETANYPPEQNNAQFPQWDGPVGNCGNWSHHLGLDISFDEQTDCHDTLQSRLGLSIALLKVLRELYYKSKIKECSETVISHQLNNSEGKKTR